MQQKNYPDSDVLERAMLLWLFHDKELREQHLDKILPAMFLHPTRRLLIYVMQKMKDKEVEITVPTIVLFIQNNVETLKLFIQRNKIIIPDENGIRDILFDPEINVKNKDYFDGVFKDLIRYAFARFVEDKVSEIQFENSYPGKYESGILAKAKGIIKVHDMLHGKIGDKRDQLNETRELINNSDEYISTSSQVLNSYIGGWTRGYVATVIAKSGHTKSSWIDYDTSHSLLSGKISSAVIISPEEIASTRWRRLIAMIFKIPTSMMRQKLVQVSDEHIKKIREIFKDKLIIYDQVTKYKDILDLMSTLKCDKVIVDHLQSIEYPGTKDYLGNMIGNIPGIIDFEKRIAKLRKMVIINLSQVGDKEIQRSDRLSKAPRYYDAYGSSVLYQASREFLSIYYPFRDYEDNPMIFGANPPTINDISCSIEKSSFSKLGKVRWNFDPEFNTFTDKPSKHLGKENYIPPAEKAIDQMGLF